MVHQIRVKGGVLLSAVVSGALAAGALSGAPTAKADCASFFGIGNTAQCSSTLFSVAIAIGTQAEAHADGLFGSAFSMGFRAHAATTDAFDFALAEGARAGATAGGLFGIAAQLGDFGNVVTQGSGSLGNLGFNIALNMNTYAGGSALNSSDANASGFGNVAVNLFGGGSTPVGEVAYAQGVSNVTVNLGGINNIVTSGHGGTGAFNLAFNIFGSGNTVDAGPGPLAIAGTILQNVQTITTTGPGFHINGIAVGGAAARNAKTAAPAATAVHTGNKTVAPAATATGRGKR
jgi:hypothetical protein